MDFTRQQEILRAVVRYVNEDWRLMRDEPLEVLDAWLENDRMLFVYEFPGGIILGLDSGWESPIGFTDSSDDQLAEEIARYSILEPRGTGAPRQPISGPIYWWGRSSAYHPRTLSELRSLRGFPGRSTADEP